MTSFDEYAEKHDLKPVSGSAAAWLEEHPELVEQIRQAREYPPARWSDIHRWLINEHDYPLKDAKSITIYMRQS